MNDKLYIKKLIRDDGQTFSFDGEEIYLAQDNTLLVRPDPNTTAVNYTEADGGEMIRQQNTIYDQPINGLIVPKSTDYWALTSQLSLFFQINHTYKIVYIKKDGTMFASSGAWISAGLQIVPVPHEEYSRWSITMSIGDTAWTEYAEDDSGKEIYSNTITLPLLSAATGGEEWEYQDQEAVSGEGSEIELDTDFGATVTDLDIKGDTFQQTYSGKNLFNFNNGTTVLNNASIGKVTMTLQDNSIVLTTTGDSASSIYSNTDFELDSTKTYVISGKAKKLVGGTGGNPRLNVTYLTSDDGTTWSVSTTGYSNATPTTGTEYSFNFTVSGHKYYRVRFYNNTGVHGSVGESTTYYEVQLELGSTPTSFEPFVGGTASPNPDYPQDINVVTGEQTVWVHGKNIFSGQYSQFDNTGGTGSTYAYFKLPDDGVYQLTLIAKNAVTANDHTYLGFTSTGGNTTNPRSWAWQDHMTANAGDIITKSNIVSDTNLRYVSLYGKSADTLTWFTDNFDIMLEKAEVATTYEPYQGSATYTIDLGSIELCKIGTYQDYIYKSGDDWYIHKAIDKNVLDGTNDEEYSLQNSTDITQTFQLTNFVFIATPAGNTPMAMSNQYLPSTNSNVNGTDNLAFTFNISGYLRFNLRKTTASNVTGLRTWLGANNLIIYYPLTTPTDTKITDNTLIGELEALYTMQGYNEKTIITVSTVSTNQPAILAVTLQNPPITGEVWDEVGTVWELGSGGAQTININSTRAIYPLWVVEGPCVNPKLQNNTTDTLAEFDGTVAAGQTLTVDFAAGTAYLNSALVTRFITGMVSLAPGENVVGFNSDGGATETSTISWNNIVN